MMSTPFSKNKEKRPRPSAETNKSFVRNVTSRMSGLLPATITKWFSSPSSSNTNGSAQVADATDSSTEDEALESPVTTQPPAKRMRYSPPGNFNQFVHVETKSTSTNTEPIDEPPNTVQSPMDRNNARRENIYASTRLQSDNDPTCYSSQNDSFFKSQLLLSPVGQSMAKKRKSLFDNSGNDSIYKPSQTPSGNTRDPYFKPSLLSSPFYVGRTMYGGAASSYMNQPNIKQRKINLTNESTNNNSVTISHSARRVMDLLEHYSSPLIEAKRIPPFQVTKQSEISSSNDSSPKHVNPYGPKSFSYKTQELQVPSVASILTIKRKSRLMDTTNAARQIIASHSSTSEFLPYPKTNSEQNSQKDASGDKLTTKVKSRLSRPNRERNIEVESVTADKVTLPNVVLQIDKDNLPKFTFDSLQKSQLSNASLIPKTVSVLPDGANVIPGNDTSAAVKTNDKVNKSADKVDSKEDKYKFSSPVKISSNSVNPSCTPSKFNFGSPERNIEKVHEKPDMEEPPIGLNIQNVIENKLPVPKSSDWRCLDCWVLNKADVKNCVCCDGKKPVDFEDSSKKCSSCNIFTSESQSDKCSECAKKTNNIDKTFVAKITKSSKWKCNDCWVDNDESANKCVCCGGINPKKNQVTSSGSSSETKVETEWKCNDCWVKNKSTLDKCAACCAQKPVSKSSDIPNLPKSNDVPKEVKVTSDNTFESIAKSQREKWECPYCLVRNDSDRTTCICCEVDKPGSLKESKKNIFNFHQPSEITFKFGIQPTNQESTIKPQNIETEEANMVEESETNNNVVSKAAPSFTFGLPSKKIEDKSDNQMLKLEGAPKINFSFGVPKDSTIPSIFGSPVVPDITKNAEEKEKPQEVPRVFTSTASEGLLKTSDSLFKPPVTSQNSQEISTVLPIQPPTTNKDLSFFNAPVMSTANAEVKTPQSSFTFSSIKPTTNLFAATTTTPAGTSIVAPLTLTSPGTSTLSIFQKPDVTTTTTVSFFQSSAPTTTTTASLFPKAETTVTTSSVSLGNAQPVFSFGSSAPPMQAEKHKFQFSFGSNKTETQSLFKPTFGVSNDNNVSNNSFNMPPNTITTGNGLSASPLNNTTQVNTANPLTTGNSLSLTAPTPNLFGTSLPKESMWPTNNNIMFATNTTTNTVQKPPAFTFGASSPFNANNTTFGTNTQPTQNVFGIPSTTSQPMFGSPQLNNPTTANIFGSPQNPTNSMPPVGMFGTPNTGGTPAFGATNPTMPFEGPTMSPTPTPTFNFGGQQPPGIFGFGQQQNQAPQQVDGQSPQTGLYNFGAPTGAPQQLQFNMGSAPQAGRRVIRKAMRRTQR